MNTSFESSVEQLVPGKRLEDIQATNLQNQRISMLETKLAESTAPLKFVSQWEVATNTPVLSLVPAIPVGSFYLIKDDGQTTIIDGTQRDVEKGGMLIAASSNPESTVAEKWEYRPASDAALILATELAAKLENFHMDAYPGKRIFCDPLGNVVLQIDEYGVITFAGQVTIEMLNFAVRALAHVNMDLYPGELIRADENGYISFRIGLDGKVSYVGQVTQEQLKQVKDLAASATAGKYPEIRPGDRAYADENGNVGFIQFKNGQVKYPGQVTQDDLLGVRDIAKAATDKLVNYFPDLYPGHYYRVDVDGNVQMHVLPDGNVESTQKTSGSSAITIPTGFFEADIIQIVITGQSLSRGGTNTVNTDFYDSKVFAGGLLTSYNPDDAAARDAYYGSGLVDMPKTGADPGKATAKIIKELIRDENQIAIENQGYTILVNSAGDGGLSLAMLAATSGIYYRRTLESIRKAKDFALAQGKSFAVPALVYLQAENTGDRGSSQADWYNKLDTFFTSLNTAIKAITGQVSDVQFFTYQIASNMEAGTGVPFAQLKLTQEKANVHFGSAMYQHEYADALHLTSASYRIMHASIGVAAKRAIVDRKKQPAISPKSWTIQKNEAGTAWLIQMPMNVAAPPLVFDETHKVYKDPNDPANAGLNFNLHYIRPVTNHGFSIKNGSTEIITSVTIARGNTLNILCNQDPAGLTLSYALGGKDCGGHLRDSQGDKVKIACDGIMKRVDNWSPLFSTIL